MFSLFGRTKTQKVIGLVEIGTGCISATLTRLDTKGPPHILSYARVELPLRANRTPKEIIADILKELPEVVRGLQKKAALYTEDAHVVPQRIEQLAVILSAPWSDVRLRTLRLSRTEPFLMHEKVVERMLSDEIRAAAKNGAPSNILIERTVVGIVLNGYPVQMLPRTKVTSAEVSLLTSYAEPEFLSKVTSVLEEAAPGIPRTFHSSTFASYLGLASAFPTEESALFVHVGGEITEVVVIKEGMLQSVGSFPQGYNLVLRTLQAASIPPHEAESAMKLSLADTSRMKATLAKTLSAASLDWRKLLRETLIELVPGGAVPQKVFLAVSGSAAPWFRETIEAESFLSVASASAPTVILLTPKEFVKRAVVANELPDAIALLTALFADQRFDQGASIDFLSTRSTVGVPTRDLRKA